MTTPPAAPALSDALARIEVTYEPAPRAPPPTRRVCSPSSPP